MKYKGIDLSSYFVVNKIEGRGVAASEVSTISSPGMDGAFFSAKRRPTRELDISFTIKSADEYELRQKIDELNALLDVNEPTPIVFDDEPDKTYYGVPEAIGENGEFITYHQGSLTFICPDPYKYGQEIEAEFPSDRVILTNRGSAAVRPLFELQVTEPLTYVLLQNQHEEYMMIGRPADDDVEAIDTKTSVLYENGSSIDEWQDASIDMVDRNIGDVSGTMGTDGAGIRPSNYGTRNNQQRGAAATKELTDAVQDFELETSFDILSRRERENWRMVIYLHDENMNNIGHVGLKDNSRTYKRRRPLGRVGSWHRHGADGKYVMGDSSWTNDNARDTTLYYLRMKREGKRFSFYVGEWQSFRHIHSWNGSYNDNGNKWQGKVKYVTLFIGIYQDRPIPSRIRMNYVELFELTSAVEDRTPYIAYPGDVIHFDHDAGDILINGEDRSDIKDFGGNYFDLETGQNELIVHPAKALTTKAIYQEKFK